jgi:hypothetical protein
MRHWFRRLGSCFSPKARRSAPQASILVEALEDRDIPSMIFMTGPNGGMMMTTPANTGTMPPVMSMSVSPMSISPMSGTMMNTLTMQPMSPSPQGLAALNQFFADFEHSLQQVLSSTTAAEKFSNEIAMIQLLLNDFSRL